MHSHRPRIALLAAAMSVAAALAVWGLAFRSFGGLWLDNVTLAGFEGLMRPSVKPLAQDLVSIVDPLPFALLSLGVLCLALARGLPRVALAVAVALAGANLTTFYLQPALATPREWHGLSVVAPESWPSGHTTATMSLVLCLVLISSPRLRPFAAAAGGLVVVAMVFSILALGLHLPSDVLGGFAVASAWTWLAVAGLWAAEDRWPSGAGREAAVRLESVLMPSAAAGVAVCLLAAGLVLMRAAEVIAYAEAHTAFVAAAGAIGVVGLSLVAGLAAMLRQE